MTSVAEDLWLLLKEFDTLFLTELSRLDKAPVLLFFDFDRSEETPPSFLVRLEDSPLLEAILIGSSYEATDTLFVLTEDMLCGFLFRVR